MPIKYDELMALKNLGQKYAGVEFFPSPLVGEGGADEVRAG